MSVKTRNEPADRALRAVGFVRRLRGADDPIHFMVHCTDETVAGPIEDAGRWFVTSSDCDLEYAMTPGDDTAPAVPSSPPNGSSATPAP
jgi:hypothetical protein